MDPVPLAILILAAVIAVPTWLIGRASMRRYSRQSDLLSLVDPPRHERILGRLIGIVTVVVCYVAPALLSGFFSLGWISIAAAAAFIIISSMLTDPHPGHTPFTPFIPSLLSWIGRVLYTWGLYAIGHWLSHSLL
jgi:hypothetical protein